MRNFTHEKYISEEAPGVIKDIVRDYASPVVAYKGGNVERDTLNELGIKNLNLETLGCPKYDTLIRDPLYRDHSSPCNIHITKSNKTYHCSLSEVKTFRKWYKNTIK